jgi:hypothetical protein
MTREDIQDALSHIARAHELRTTNQAIIEASTQLDRDAVTLLQRAEKLHAATNLLLRAQEEEAALQEWDKLVEDWNEGDMEAVKRIFLREGWPEGVQYPNLVGYGKWTKEQHEE